MSRLDEIKARVEAATPGPWPKDYVYNAIRHISRNCDFIESDIDPEFGWLYGPVDDPTFIAHAREDIPYLLAEVERLIMRAKTAETAARLTEASPSAFEFTVAIAKKSVEIKRLRAALEDAKDVLDKPATELSRSARLHLIEAIIEQTLAAQDAKSDADYIRSEAERLPNGTAAKFIAALDAMDGATNQKGRGAEVSGLSEGEGCREGGES